MMDMRDAVALVKVFSHTHTQSEEKKYAQGLVEQQNIHRYTCEHECFAFVHVYVKYNNMTNNW